MVFVFCGGIYEMYVVIVFGGVWKIENEGIIWFFVFEYGFLISVGDVIIVLFDYEMVWIGLGEVNIFCSLMVGVGVYKLIDGGKIWNWKGFGVMYMILWIVIYLEDFNIVYVVVLGYEWINNFEWGLYKLMDGGELWKKVFYIDE